MAKRKVKKNGNGKIKHADVPLDKRIVFFWDFDLTLSEVYQQQPLLEDCWDNIRKAYHGKPWGKVKRLNLKKPSDYFKVVDAWGVPQNGIGYLEQMVYDSKQGILPPLTRELFLEIGSRVKLSPGMPHFLKAIREKWVERGVEVYHFIVSVGIKEIIEGNEIANHVDGIYASELYALGDEKSYNVIRDVVSPFTKSKVLIELAKGDPKLLDNVLMFDDYFFDYRNAFIFGDGGSDKSILGYGGNKGALGVGVVEAGDNQKLLDVIAKNYFSGRAHAVGERDYRRRQSMWRFVCRHISKKTLRKCSMDPHDVSQYRKNKIEDYKRETVAKHIENCAYCEGMSDPTIHLIR